MENAGSLDSDELSSALYKKWALVDLEYQKIRGCSIVEAVFRQINQVHEVLITVLGVRQWMRSFISFRSARRGQAMQAKLLLCDHVDLDNRYFDPPLHAEWQRLKCLAATPALLEGGFNLDTLHDCFKNHYTPVT